MNVWSQHFSTQKNCSAILLTFSFALIAFSAMISKDKAAAGANFNSSNDIVENDFELHRTSTFAGNAGPGLWTG